MGWTRENKERERKITMQFCDHMYIADGACLYLNINAQANTGAGTGGGPADTIASSANAANMNVNTGK